MKKRFTSLMTLVVMLLCTSSAWAQSVVSVGANLDFAEGTPVDNGICTYGRDMTTNSTTYYSLLAVDGWTAQPQGPTEDGYENCALAGGLFAYGSGHWLGGTGYNVPTTNPAGVAEGNALGIVAVWGNTAQYTQAVTLEAGSYELHVAVYNAVGGTTAPTKSLIGFIADNGTEYLAPAKAYAVDAWTEEVIAFTLTEATTGKLSLGYVAPGAGSSANQHLFVDKVEILSVETPITVESPWVGAAVENGKTYYLYNTKAKAFLNGANSWGTQASLGQDGLPFIAEGADGVFAFNGVVSNGGASHYLGNGGYIDSGSAQFTLTEVIDGVYTIGWGTNYYASAEGSTILATVTELSDACYWQFLTAEDIHAGMASATAENPLNVTSLLPCSNFGRNNTDFSKWQGSPARGGENDNMCAERFNMNFDVYQTISVPNGLYKVTAQGFYRMGGYEAAADTIEAGCTSTNAVLYANEKSVAFPNIYVDSASVTAGVAVLGHGTVPNNMNDASKAFTAGLYQMDTIDVAVLNGQLTIGFKKDVTVPEDWSIFDNVQIIYCGSDFTAEAVGSVNPADYPANQLFAIMNVNGKNFLTANSGITVDARDEENANQCFYFVATETANQYHLKTYGGKYVKSDHGNTWSMTAATEASANTLHEITAIEPGVYTIGMVGKGKVIGADAVTNGSSTYSDKSADKNGKWYIIPVTYDITSALQAIIDDAKTITGAMSKAASEELAAAIAAAEAAIAIELPDTVTGATTRLNAAVEDATASVADYAALSANIAVYEAMYVEGAGGAVEFGAAVAAAKAALAEGTADAETLTTLAAAYSLYLSTNEIAGIVNGTFDAPNQKNGWVDGVSSMGTGNHNKWTNVNDGFVEKWNAAPTALADLDFYQIVEGLPAGTYTFAAYVSACLQSQEDTYEVKGVKLYANGDSVEVHTANVDRNDANRAAGPELIMVKTTIAEGDSLKVGISVKNTDANWIVMDNAKLYTFDPAVVMSFKLDEAKALLEQNPHVSGVFGEELKAQVAAADDLVALNAAMDSFVVAIPAYSTLNAIVTEYENAELLAEAVATAKGVLTSTTATVADVEAAYVVFEQAVYEYRFAVATVDYACDMTSRYIVNPKMEDGTKGWTNDMQTQNGPYTNGDVEIVQFIEKWANAAPLGTAYATQVVRELPKGLYRLSADIIATRQDAADAKAAVEGAYLFMNGDSVAVATGNGAPERFEVYTNLTSADTIILGFTAVNTTANWVCFDNVKLEYCGKQSNIGYFTLEKELAEGASDPIYAMLAADPKLNVTLNVITDKSETAVVDLSGYDAIIVQESFGSSDGILTKGALSPSNVKVPYLINKIFGFQKDRITDGATTETEGTLNLTVVNAESPLFNGIEGTDVKMFHAGADDNAGNTRNKTFGYSTGVTLSAEGTLVAAPTGAADAAQVAINVIPAGATVGTHTLEAQMITMNMNYGAITREAGRYMTDANYTLWRNAVYTLVGLDVPAEGVDMAVNDDCDVTGVALDTAAVTLKEGETYTFTATVAPATSVDQSVVWSSSDEAVATVANGVVTAVSFGRATITVTTVDGGFKATATVTVAPTKAAKWDFRAWDATVLEAIKADGDNWREASGYLQYKIATTASALMVGENELEATKGLLFTARTRQICVYSSEEDLMANYIMPTGNITIVIPALATDTITIGAAEYTLEGATLVDGVYVADQDNVTLNLPKDVALYYIDLVAGPGTGIANVEGEVASRAYYNLSGVVVDTPVQGINIVKTTYKDGTVKVQKVYIK